MKAENFPTYKSLSYIPMFIISALGIMGLFSKGYFEYHHYNQGLGWISTAADEDLMGAYRYLCRSAVPVIFAVLFLLLPPIISFINQSFKKRSLNIMSVVCAARAFVYILVSSIYFSENFDFYGRATESGNYYYVFNHFGVNFYIELLLHIAMIAIPVLDVIGKPVLKKPYKHPVPVNINNDGASKAFGRSNADELKKYKELLDAGIITQEEFDAKKKQLLGL